MKTASIITLALLASPLAASARLSRTTQAAAAPIDLGFCSRFALHGTTGVAASAMLTEVKGDVGGDNAITGFGADPLPHVFAGQGYGYYSVTDESNLCAASKPIAYAAAKGKSCGVEDTATDLGGLTLGPDVYCNTAGYFEITAGALTLDANMDPDAVFIFQAATTVITSISTDIILINGAQAKNVFWQAGTAINLAGYSEFRGNLLAGTAITMGTGAVLQGRALAGTAVTLAGANNISLPEL